MRESFRTHRGQVPVKVTSHQELWNVHSTVAKRVTETADKSPLRHAIAQEDFNTTLGLCIKHGMAIDPWGGDLSQPVGFGEDIDVPSKISEGQLALWGVEHE